jgi:two-component system, cell cycle sensor histidine kinase and response regulator CckA
MTLSHGSADLPVEPTDERFKELVGTIDAIVTEYDRRTNRFTYISEQAERILGYAPEQLEEALLSPVDEEERMRIEAVTARAVRKRTDFAYECRVRAADGRLVWLRVSASLVLDEQGEPVLIRGVWLDVTALKQAQAARESSYSLLQATLDATADAILVVNVKGHITTYNRPFAELWPIPQAVLDAGDDAAALESVVSRLADPAEFLRRVSEIYEDPESVTYDVIELVDGRTLERDSAPQRLGNEVVGRVWCFRDITEKLAAQEALSTREELFRSLIENASDAVTMLSADGTSLYESPSVERILGYPPEEILGTHSFSLLHPDDHEAVRQTFAAMLAGEEPVPIEVRLRHRNGSWRTVEALGRRRRQDGEWVVVVNYRDVTDQRLLQEQLLHAQKLESVGRLAGGVAHDFNNLLTAIGGYSEFLVASFDDDDPRRSDALEIVRASDRAAALTSQLLAFSRHQVLLAEILDLGEVVEELERLISGLLGDDVELSTSVTPGCRVRVDGGQIEQVITNLVLNARDAMPSGGKVELGVQRLDTEVELTVRDTGVGMDAETVNLIFEPFFTTKEAGKGTGLGLATVYGIVNQSGGAISVTSELGEGSTFRIVLPLSVDDESAPIERAERSVERNATEGVLLAEDEETIRSLVGEVLTRSGYKVFAAPNGDEAILLLSQHVGEIDLLLTDVVMPGMGGPDLARAAARLSPNLRVLYTSGYASEPDEAFEDPDVAFIGKPFSPNELVSKVRDVLDAP